MQQLLTEILLNDDVVNSFYNNYNTNTKFRTWLTSILPEIEDCKKLKQDNPWHIYNCLDHILHSVEEINKLSTHLNDNARKILAYTMFLHDIGKPACHIRRYSKLYKKEIDSFFNHNKASVDVAKRVLPAWGFNNNEQQIIQKLVFEHDVFMFITLEDDHNPYHHVLTYDYLNSLIKNLNQTHDGITMIKWLTLVGKADNLAQNPQLTGPSLLTIDKMQNMINSLENNPSGENL